MLKYGRGRVSKVIRRVGEIMTIHHGSLDYIQTELRRRPSVIKAHVYDEGIGVINILVYLNTMCFGDLKFLLKYISDIIPISVIVRDIKITYSYRDYVISKFLLDIINLLK